ncbi:hypothetical protein EQH23_05650 [Streptococcus pneumoniae]|uniref:Uncharacterized protein n=1 Tax=Streptococcus pneumoniae TaxID=1313 RepID=A0A559E0I7_STREE|nr:hypothetical protein BUM80_02905 [Streptococcus pneumoniae]AXJ88362.1 hypothetical protein C1H54_05225 [Streptococcus pneumoniae]TNW37496.1 hypothetical protein FIU68_11250 [Streptococcus pneumoniae]TVW84464.1 hypothetical protein AZJ70_06260 [Streptococcus pneumoniae]TVX32149.1 hypothetical protein AZJ40_11580 [Streptococcus pneumoniae]
MSCFVAFHYRSYGTFFLHKIGSIISIGDLPTTNIIEPKVLGCLILCVFYNFCTFLSLCYRQALF